MIRIWPRKPHDVQTSHKRRTDDHHHNDVTQSGDVTQPTSHSSRAHRYTKGGSLDSRYSSDAAKSYSHLVFGQPNGLVPFVAAEPSNGKRSQQQLPQQLPQPQQQQQQQPQQQQPSAQKGEHPFETNYIRYKVILFKMC